MNHIYIKRDMWRKGITLILVLCFSLAILTTLRHKYTGAFMELKRKLPIYCVDTNEKKVALTFDAGWAEDNTDEILEILNKYDVKATFFPVGVWVDKNQEKLKKMFESGNEIGNHTNMHPNMKNISKASLIKEIEVEDSKIINITGQNTKLFRCPSGEYSNEIIETAEGLGKKCIQWDVDSIDWKNQGEEIEYNRVIKKIKPGSIVLFHNEAKYTPKNLQKIIVKLKDEGYEFVTVSKLIYTEDYRIDSDGKQIYLKKH
jgi:polysaccharide deacetylase family sporulation protein PdaB